MLEHEEQRISSVILEYLKYHQSCNHSPRTIEYHREKLAKFMGFMRSINITLMNDITPSMIRDYIISLQHLHSDGGVLTIYRSLRSFLNWYEFEVDSDEFKNPVHKVKAPKKPELLLEPVPEDVVEKLLQASAQSSNPNRDRAFVLFLQATGGRISEVLALNVADVDINACSAIIYHGKGGYYRHIFFDRKTRNILRAYLRERRDNFKPLWISRFNDRLTYGGARSVLRRLTKAAGMAKPPSFHSFRRRFAVERLDSGTPDLTVVQLMGQHSINSLRPYTKMSKEILQRAYNRSIDNK